MYMGLRIRGKQELDMMTAWATEVAKKVLPPALLHVPPTLLGLGALFKVTSTHAVVFSACVRTFVRCS